MNLYLRLLYTWLFARFRTRVGSLGPSVTPFRCWPSDIDLLRHMNNGKYFSIMDIARIDLLVRAGLSQVLKDRGWYPVVVAETARFRKSIKLFRKFEVETAVIGWDEKAILIKQVFSHKDTVYCEGVIRGRFLKKSGGSVPVDKLIEALQISDPRPQLDKWIEDWNKQQQ